MGKSPAELIAVLLKRIQPGVGPDRKPTMFFQPAEGTFLTEGEANSLVSSALRDHPELVERAVAGNNQVTIDQDFSYPTGIEAYIDEWDAIPNIRPTTKVRILIGYDPRPGTRGYVVITAFPMNDQPNERFKMTEIDIPPAFRAFAAAYGLDEEVTGERFDSTDALIDNALQHRTSVEERAELYRFLGELLNSDLSDADLHRLWMQSGPWIAHDRSAYRGLFAATREKLSAGQ